MGRYRHPLLNKEAGVYGYDQLVVLRSTRMPAVLLEAGLDHQPGRRTQDGLA